MAKTFVSLSFDDGRDDTAKVAYPIMEKYGIKSTVHITTGFIDGSWVTDKWKSCNTPMTKEDILDMQKDGHEISLHGDKHTSTSDDFDISLQKLTSWGVDTSYIGFSIPNSDLNEEEKEKFVNHLRNKNIFYMRGGRNEKCYSLISKFCFLIFKFFKLQKFYTFFNCHNLNKNNDRYNLDSIVVRCEDKAENIIKFIKKNSVNCHIILMLHSILGKDSPKYNADAWCWDSDQFERLCISLKDMQEQGVICVEPIIEVVKSMHP